ncbi:hypothetical protein [Bradyrhizobium diazoefficiens]|uniref:hypothetical protein n=1 Tax=Bradyrhizobium diazoefficiens TaxID=1355477 RepID=UPI001B779EF4|nr:hypothetical protein [Bradyrhizobium japonicum]
MRFWPTFAAIALLAQPAWGQGPIDPGTLQRDIAAGDALVDKWIECTRIATAKLAGSSREGAEVIAVAVFGACAGFQERLYQHFLRTKMTVKQADDYTEKIRGKLREQIVAQVVTLRTETPERR